MADSHEGESNGGTRKLKQGFSLEKLIGKLKTTSPPSCNIGGSGDPSSEQVANGSAHPVSEKKSRRKGNPVNYVAASAQYEDNLDDSLTTIDGDLALEDLDDNQPSISDSKLASRVPDTISTPATSTPKRPVPATSVQKSAEPSRQDEIPEGTVVVNPEAPSVEEENNAPDVNPEMAGSELALRTAVSSGVDQSETSQCTTCREPLYLKEPQNIRQHPVLKVILCKSCYTFYSSGDFTKDEEGYDNQCTWCGEGGNLLICDFCPKAFCKKCIRNNFKRDMLKHIENCRKWKCLVCDPKPLASHVVKSSQLQERVNLVKKMAKEQWRSQKQSSKPSNQDTSKDSRDNRRNLVKVAQTRKPTTGSVTPAAPNTYRTIVSRTTAPANTSSATPAAPAATAAARGSAGADCESRVYINVPAHANIRGGEKAILSVNLSTVAAQYINAQKIRCDNTFLENLVQEHNRFSKALAEAKQVLTLAHNQYEALVTTTTDQQVQAKAKGFYRDNCDKLGTVLKSKMVNNITGVIKLISPSSAAKSATTKAAAPATAAPPAAAAPTAALTSTTRSTFNQTATAAPRTRTAAPIIAPTPTTTSAAAPTTQKSTTIVTRSTETSRRANSSVLPTPVVKPKDREFIDMDELKKSTAKEKEVICLSSDDDDTSSQPTPLTTNIKKQPVVVVCKPSAANNLRAATQSAPGKSTTLSNQSEEFDVGCPDPFSPTTADPLLLSSHNQTKDAHTSRVNELLDFSVDSATTSMDKPIPSDGSEKKQEKPPSRSDSPLIESSYADLKFSSSDEDDLVGVTPRRSTRSKVSTAGKEVASTTTESTSRKGQQSKDKGSSEKGAKQTSDDQPKMDETDIFLSDETGSNDGQSGTDKTKASTSAEQTETATDDRTEDEPKAGPSGLSRRALKRLLKQQERDKDTMKESRKKRTQSQEASTDKSPDKAKVLSKEFLSSSSDDDDTPTTQDKSAASLDESAPPVSPVTPEHASQSSSSESKRRTKTGSDKTPTSAKLESSESDNDSGDESGKNSDTLPPKASPEESQQSTNKKQSDSENENMDTSVTLKRRKRKHRHSSDSESDRENRTRRSSKRTARSSKDVSPSKRESNTLAKGAKGHSEKSKNDSKIDESCTTLDSLAEEGNDASDSSDTKVATALAGLTTDSSPVKDSDDSQLEESETPVLRRTKKVASTSSRRRTRHQANSDTMKKDSEGSSTDDEKMVNSKKTMAKAGGSSKKDDTHKSARDKKSEKYVSATNLDDSDASTVEQYISALSDAKSLSSEDEEGHKKTKTGSSRREKTSTTSMKPKATVVSDEDELLGGASSSEEVLNEDALLGDSDTEEVPESFTVDEIIPQTATAHEDSDATLTDTVKNTKALNELDELLSSSDLDSDPPPRVLPRRRAKEPHKQKKKAKTKSKPLTSAERQEKEIMRLKPEQRRYMRQRASGLRVSLIEKKQTQLQTLLTQIDSKTVEEMDTDNKLAMRLEVGLEKRDLTDQDVVQKVVTNYQSTKKTTKKKMELEQDSDADSDVEKEIERLAKFKVLLKKAGVKSEKRPDRNKKRPKKEKEVTRKIKGGISDTDSLSDISAAQSGNESDADDSSSNSDNNKSDIIVIPNKDQMDNEEAMKALLQQMADTDSEDGSLSSVNSADADDSDKEVKKKDPNRKSKRKGRKVHPLEQEGLGEKKGGRKRRVSSDSSSDSDDDDKDMDSSGSDVIKRRRKRKFHHSDNDASSDSDDSLDKKLSTRESKRLKKGKKRRVIKYSSDSSSGSSSSSSGSSSNSDSDSDEKVATPSKGRHKIRKLLGDDKLKDTTKSAHKLEMERRKRIEEKQKKYNEELLSSEAPQKMKTQRELVLERNSKGKVAVEVDPALVKKLKPHQIDAVRFLWDCVCETVERSKKGGGGGCILAHCMGLGKTLSLITFLHTLLTHEDKLSLRRMLVIAPLNTVLNWKDEVEKWTSNLEIDIDVDELHSSKKNLDRMYRLKRWHSTGGIMIMGYDLFRNLTSGASVKKKELRDRFQQYLIKPGADVIVCDEGHLLKNAKSGMRKSVMCTDSKRRIVLTGTPLQNNLKEYHCMVDFVKPSLLGTAAEFNNRFVAPITNGQYEDSTPFDVKLMKKRAHVLHEMLAGCVQRRDYSELTKFLPPKHEYILSVKLTELQIKLYQFYLEKVKADGKLGIKGKLFSDFQNLSRVWSHPMALELHKQRRQEENDFIDDSTSEETPSSSDEGSDILVNDGDDVWKPNKKKDKKKSAVDDLKAEDDSSRVNSGTSTPVEDHLWWVDEVKDVKMNDISLGYKFVLLLEILRKCEEIGDKVLLFSQGILTLDLIEDFLEMIHNADDEVTRTLYGHLQWKKGVNYFRIDGTVDAGQRRRACTLFNRVNNHKARLFLISTRAGGMGINLVGANRVIIFDASWNPSSDVQAIFRAFRFGQTKPVYVYRFLAQATMEERIYERQVAKLSLSERVVDEKQIHRHFTANDLSELYNFKPATEDDMEIPVLPKDLLLADMLETHGHLIVKVREHDSLLENKEDEQLSEEERKAAWQEYQQEKERVNQPPPSVASVLPPVGYTANNAGVANTTSVLSSLLLTDHEKFKLREDLAQRFPSTSGGQLQKMFESQCYEINSRRLRHHQASLGNPDLTPTQIQLLQSHMKRQQQQQQQRSNMYLQQQLLAQQQLQQQQRQRQLQQQQQQQQQQRQQQQAQQSRQQPFPFPVRK